MDLEKQLKEMLGGFYSKKVFNPEIHTKKTDQHVLHEPFSIDVHKEYFVMYLEIIILENGEVYYAVPSHRYFCEAYIMFKNNWTVEQMKKACPREFWGDYNRWLTKESGALMVWDYRYEGEPNKKQIEVLEELQREGLYLGKLEQKKKEKQIDIVFDNGFDYYFEEDEKEGK